MVWARDEDAHACARGRLRERRRTRRRRTRRTTRRASAARDTRAGPHRAHLRPGSGPAGPDPTGPGRASAPARVRPPHQHHARLRAHLRARLRPASAPLLGWSDSTPTAPTPTPTPTPIHPTGPSQLRPQVCRAPRSSARNREPRAQSDLRVGRRVRLESRHRRRCPRDGCRGRRGVRATRRVCPRPRRAGHHPRYRPKRTVRPPLRRAPQRPGHHQGVHRQQLALSITVIRVPAAVSQSPRQTTPAEVQLLEDLVEVAIDEHVARGGRMTTAFVVRKATCDANGDARPCAFPAGGTPSRWNPKPRSGVDSRDSVCAVSLKSTAVMSRRWKDADTNGFRGAEPHARALKRVGGLVAETRCSASPRRSREGNGVAVSPLAAPRSWAARRRPSPPSR